MKNHWSPQSSFSSPLVFDSVEIKYYFPLLIDSNSAGTVDYDAYMITKINHSINHVFKSITIQKLNSQYHICELEKTQLLKITVQALISLVKF